jgi:hypothetical protein
MVSKYDDIVQTLQNVRGRVKDLEMEMRNVKVFTQGFFGQPPFLVYLSVAEQKTFEVLKSLEKPATAQEVAALTGRARAVESMYLNGLFRRNMVLKGRDRRRQYFLLKREYRKT